MASGTLIVAALLGISGAAPGPEPASPAAPRRDVPVTAVALAATGVVGLAGGVFFGLRAREIESAIEEQRRLVPNEVYQDRMDRGRRAETLQWWSYAVGAAALAGSAAVYLFTRPGHRDGAPVAAAVAATPFGAAVTLEGRF